MSDALPIAATVETGEARNFAHSVSIRLATVVLVSAIALLPCFWLPHIEAGDLGSHLYNAWLTQLLEKGQAPGLWIAPQTNNVLFDFVLLRLSSLLGFSITEKLATCIAVLVFLWSAYALVSTLEAKPAWFLLPVLTMLSYGWAFHMGFFNFYLSLGLAFLSLALLLRERGYKLIWIVPLAALMWLAHPLGLVWFVSVGAYLLLARSLKPRSQIFLAGSGLALIMALHFYLGHFFELSWWQGNYADLLGTDQVVLGTHYQFLSWLLLLAIAGSVVLHLMRVSWTEVKWSEFFPPALQVYGLSFLALALLPEAIKLPWYNEPLGFIGSRFTLATAVMGCSALNRLRQRMLFGILSAAIAVCYFTLVYQDAAKTNALEKQAETLVARVPEHARIITTIFPFRDFRVFVHHVTDRACIGRCFIIDNYEPASTQFRLRATPGNRFVEADDTKMNDMQLGRYVVQANDLPVWQIFQCGPTDVDLCLRPLRPGSLRDNTDVIERARPLPQ